MPKTNIKTIHKENRRKKLGPNNTQSANLNQTNRIPSDRDRRKYKLPDLNAVQSFMDVKNSSILNNLENHDIFKENYNCNQELVALQEKIADLVNERNDLIRYHKILRGFDNNNCLKNIKSLESEMSDIKCMVGILQKGLNIILDEHSVIKSLVIDHIKDMDNLLDWNSNQGSPKNRYNCSENPEKCSSPRFNENSCFLLPSYMNSNQSLFDICKTSSVFNYSNSHLFKTISKISAFGDSVKNDSMAKFRQIAELKIMIEILQKYSEIVSDEFKNLSSVEVADQNPLDFKLKTKSKTDQQDHRVKFQLETVLSGPENNVKPSCHIHPVCSSPKCEANILKTRLELPQEDLNVFLNKYKKGAGAVTEEQLEVSSNVMKSNSSRGNIIENVILNTGESNKNLDNILFKSSSLCKTSVFVEEYNLNTPMTNNKKIVSSSLNGFGHDAKQSKKKKVLFLSDGHGRYCSHFLQDELGPNFSVISVTKPDALFKEIIKDFQHLASSFSREDYVIIFAGSNNLKCKNKTQSHIELELVLPILKHTNVIFTSLPLLFDHPSLNSQIRRVNSENSRKVFELARKNSNILYMPKFTFFSRDHPKQNFNKIGKKTLCKHLAKTIINHSFGKIHKSCVESQCTKTFKLSAAPNPQEVTSSQLLSYVNEIKISTTTICGVSTENKDYESKGGAFVNMHQINKCEFHESNQQFRKSAQTQTSEENLNECPCQMTNDKFLNVNPKLLIDGRTSSMNCVEKAKPHTQTTMIEQHSNTDRRVGDFCKDYNSEDHRQQQGFFAGIFMKNNHKNMSTMKELLGQGDIPKPRKNFIQENVKRLKELKLEKTNKLGSQRSKNPQPLTERRNAQTMVSSSRFSQRPTSQQSPSPLLHSRRTNKHVTLDTQSTILEVDESPKGYRSQGCQTLSSKQLEHLYDEGVIRYPSVRDMGSYAGGEGRTVREMALQTETPLEVLHPAPQPSHIAPPLLDEGLHWDEEKKAGDKDFVKMNATVPDPRRHKTPDPSSTDPTRAPSTYQRGIVPKYLREHKKEIERERINKAKEDECPEGHIQLPDDIKQKHLNTLRQNYTELVSQLNQLPVSTDTLRTRTRKKQIETDLDRIEAAIALFSREKVFVKADS